MSEKPLCGYCYNECADDCCDKRRIDVLESQLDKIREELLSYKVKYNNQCSEMNRLKQSRKDQLAMIRKLKEQGNE